MLIFNPRNGSTLLNWKIYTIKKLLNSFKEKDAKQLEVGGKDKLTLKGRIAKSMRSVTRVKVNFNPTDKTNLIIQSCLCNRRLFYFLLFGNDEYVNLLKKKKKEKCVGLVIIFLFNFFSSPSWVAKYDWPPN